MNEPRIYPISTSIWTSVVQNQPCINSYKKNPYVLNKRHPSKLQPLNHSVVSCLLHHLVTQSHAIESFSCQTNHSIASVIGIQSNTPSIKKKDLQQDHDKRESNNNKDFIASAPSHRPLACLQSSLFPLCCVSDASLAKTALLLAENETSLQVCPLRETDLVASGTDRSKLSRCRTEEIA